MNYEELLRKYNALVIENQKLHNEIKVLKEQFGITERNLESSSQAEKSIMEQVFFLENIEADMSENVQPVTLSKYSDPMEKIQLFKSLFRGREDVCAKRWQNKKGTSGYSPLCSNEWETGLCLKPKGKCSDCAHKSLCSLE